MNYDIERDQDHREHHEHHASHPWKARFIVGFIMIVIAFVGLVCSNLSEKISWEYWRIAALLFAVLSIWLSAYLRKKTDSFSFTTIVREIFHWITMILGVLVFSLFVKVGIMGRFEAGIAILTTLAMVIFLAGIYIDPSFIVIGIILGAFSVGAAYLASYLYTIILPITILAIGVLFLFVYFKRKHKHPH
jgi:MFS family permease